MKKWDTIHQMGAQLCKEQVSEKQINGAEANRIAKIVAQSIAARGWWNTSRILETLIKSDTRSCHLNEDQISSTCKVLRRWFRWYWIPCSGIRKRCSHLIKRYK